MEPLAATLLIAGLSLFAGLLGSLAGVGGGAIVVPVLTWLLGVDIHTAIAASIIAVIATSNSAASGYVRQRLTNLRLAMLLEVATALGALCGALLSAWVPGHWLYLLFALMLGHTTWSMLRPGQRAGEGTARGDSPADPLAERLRLHGSFYDPSLGREVAYRVGRTRLGLAVSWLAGLVSGLLGVGGGVLKVPVMNLAMGIPIKACTATSNFMIGITAATGATLFFVRGDVQPFIAAPVAVGILLGAKIGSRLLGRMKSQWVRWGFVALTLVNAVQMFLKFWKGAA